MLLLTALVSCCLTGCREDGGDSEPTGRQPVAVKLALSVAKHQAPGDTRMLPDYLTGTVGNIQLLYVIPFIGMGNKVTIDETHETTSTINPLSFKKSVNENSGAFFTSACTFAPDVNKLLAYAYDNKSGLTNATKGALVTTFSEYEPEELEPANIRFSLKSIKTRNAYLGIDGDTDVKTIAEELADYLTSIANATTDDNKTWKEDATDSKLKIMYKNFINELSEGVGDVLPGSAANVKAWVTELKKNLEALSLTGIDYDIKNKIISLIETVDDDPATTEVNESKWDGAWKDFPASIGLPDGAAVVRWQTVTEGNETVEKFVPETQTTTIANINSIERFTYPAEIYYYGNSSTMVSNDDLSGYFESKYNWRTVLENDFTDGKVENSTKTVAMKDSLQYGVARLQAKIKTKDNATSLPDASETTPLISVGTNYFKLTGIIVGGQLPVGFDFRPKTLYPTYSEADMSFIYDKLDYDTHPIYLTYTESSAVSTLVLQSYDNRNVKIVLELENNSDKGFKGLNGTVYRGTKFYLVGEIDYTQFTEDETIPDDVKTRVFTQDYTTTITINVTTLAKAYNVLPNLLSPRLEMGIELTPQWEEATPTDVIL